MYTGQQQNSEQPNVCSSLFDKMWSHKRLPDVRDRGKSPEKKRPKSERNERNEIKSITAKLKKVTSALPWALQSNDAYSGGDKNCEGCSMTREQYKLDLHSAKVVGILVDGVVEKEQAEKMDEENERCERNERNEKTSKENGKGDKLSINLSVYYEGDVIKHSLKCVLIKLQKTLGDIMVQICFVKTRKLGNEEKYKKLNVSISDLKLLKYEYTNLTDAIIPLYKNSSTVKRRNNTEVCVACVKEKLCQYNVQLREILKTGRNLRVVMRNDGDQRNTDKCCPRGYPHVHAEVQGKPIVLKYSMPFQVKPLSKPNGPSEEQMQTEPTRRPISFQKTPSEASKGTLQFRQEPHNKPEVPYYEWPEDYIDQQNNDDNSSLPALPVKKPSSSSDSLDSLEDASKKLTQPKTRHTPEPLSDSSLSFKMSSASSMSKKSNISKNSSPLSIKPNTKTQVPAPVASKSSLLSTQSSKSSISNPGTDTVTPKKQLPVSTSEESESDTTANTLQTEKSSLYCGCNYDKAYKTLGSQLNSKPNPQKATNEDLWSSESESTSSFLKDDHRERKDNPFPYKLSNTTAFPLSTTETLNFMFPKQPSTAEYLDDSPSSHIRQQSSLKNTYDTGQIPLDEEKDKNNNQVMARKVDSLVLAKNRLSQGGEPKNCISSLKMSVSPENKAVAAAFKPFIDEPNYEIRRADKKSNNSQKEIRHQSKKLELLEHFGRDNLRSICSPAECCRKNNCLDIQDSSTELPLSPSLYSLPLDHNDLEYLARVTGTPIFYKDIMLIAEEEVPAKTGNEWEIQYAGNDSAQHKPRWLQAFGEMDEQMETDVSTTRKNSNISRSSVIFKEEPRLSTIVEEGPFCLSEDEKPSIPYMPSIPSLPLNKEEKAELIKKRRPSILRHTTMELRYFTVEFPEKGNTANKQKQQMCDERIRKLNNNTPLVNDKLIFGEISSSKTNKLLKPVTLIKARVENKSCDSFHSCSSSAELMNVNYDQIERTSILSHDKLCKSKSDEITMLNVIYLCDNSFDFYNNANTCLKTYKTTINNTQSPNVSESKLFYMGSTPEINDFYVKNLILSEDKPEHAGKNKSYTIIKNTENHIACYDQTNNTTSPKSAVKDVTNYDRSFSVTRDKNKQPWSTNRTVKFSYSNSPASIEALKADSMGLKNVSIDSNFIEKNTSTKKIISNNENTPKYISVKLNRSYTIVKGSNQYINGKSGFTNKINRPQVSYTVIKDNKMKKSLTEDDFKKQPRPVILNNSEIENDSAKNNFPSLDFKTDNSSQYPKYKQSNWSKLKPDKPNVKSYLKEQRNPKQITKIQETKMKHFKNSKRKPLILPNARISCRRTQCKVTLPRRYSPYLHPIRISYQIPSVIFVPRKIYTTIETTEERKELTQQFRNMKQTLNVENPSKKKLQSEHEQNVVQITKNKCDVQYINPMGDVKRTLSTMNSQKSEFKTTLINIKTADVYPQNPNIKVQPLKSKASTCFATIKSKINLKCPQVKLDACEVEDHLLIDLDNNPLYLFDSHGRPLTDQSGRTLRNMKGELLIVFDKLNNPKCDLDNNPICDSLGNILNKKGFNPVKPPIAVVLKSVLRDSRYPMLLYNIEGRPLTSVSGTVLVDSSGKSLIRFGCADKRISDSIGRPIFDSSGKQCNGVG